MTYFANTIEINHLYFLAHHSETTAPIYGSPNGTKLLNDKVHFSNGQNPFSNGQIPFANEFRLRMDFVRLRSGLCHL